MLNTLWPVLLLVSVLFGIINGLMPAVNSAIW